jgi:hypothetical protein
MSEETRPQGASPQPAQNPNEPIFITSPRGPQDRVGGGDLSWWERLKADFTGPSMYDAPSSGGSAPPGMVTGAPIKPSGEDMRREMLYGLGIGTGQGLSISGGAALGLRGGIAIAPFTGPAAPFMPAIGTAVGVGTAWLLSKDIDKLFPGVSSPDLVPYREGAITAGQGMGAMPFAWMVPVQTGGRVAQFMNRVRETAFTHPKSFAVGETMGATTAGALGGASVEYAPDSPATRFVAETVGGFFTPGRMVVTSLGTAKDALRNVTSKVMGENAQQQRAADRLRTILEETGEDIPRLIQRLESNLPAGAKPTAAQKTGSPTLTVLETTLGHSSPGFRNAVRAQGRETFQVYEGLVANLRAVGSQEALNAAARIESQNFSDMLAARQIAAEADAAARARNITTDSPASRAEIGRIILDKTEESLRDARMFEKQLWLNAYRDTLKRRTVQGTETLVPRNVIPENTGRSALEIATSMSPERFNSLPEDVRSIMGRLGVTPDTIAQFAAGRRTQEFLDTGVVPAQYTTRPAGPRTQRRESVFARTDVEDLINIRSDLLDFARNASSRGEVANAGFYAKLADGVLRDLDGMRMPNYDTARNFSRALNDHFTRSFAGELGQAGTRGVARYSPEIVVQRAFGANNDLAWKRMQDIEEAVGLMGRQYDSVVSQFGANSRQAQALKPFADAAKQNVTSIVDAQTRIFRLAAAQTIDPTTQRVNPRQLEKFVRDHKEALDRLQITPDLQDATRAENAFRAVLDENSVLMRNAKDQEAFAKLTAGENAKDAIVEALRSRNPVRNFSNLVQLASKGGVSAQNGLKSAVFDYAFTQAGGNSAFSPAAYQRALFEPIAYGQPSLYQLMRQQNVMSISEAKNMRRILEPMAKIETVIANGQMLPEDIIKNADAVTELALRVVGSRIGGGLVGTNGAGSLIVAQAGSKFTREIFDKMPTLMIRNMIEKAAQDPQLMADLLKRGRTEGEKFQMARALHGYLVSAGLNYASYDESQYPRRPPPKSYYDFGQPEFRASDFGITLPAPAPAAPQPGQPRIPFRSESSQMLNRLPPAPATRGVPGVTTPPAQGGPKPPAGPAGQGSPGAANKSSRMMFEQLFPMDSLGSMVAGGQPEGGPG